MINAGQSALILIFISYRYTMEEAGVFSIGYAISLLGMTLSKYGQRNFQVTDANEEFSFAEYRSSRWVTIAVAVLFVFGYMEFQYSMGRYDLGKVIAILLIFSMKQIDSAEDVYYGMYQQQGRLDIGAKRYSERLIFSTVLFCFLAICRVPFILLLLIVVITSVIVAFFLIRIDAREVIGEKLQATTWKRIVELLRDSFTLCISSTLTVYIGNMPKYFIDIYLSDNLQARFGYLMMPAFVIMILSMVIFQPVIKDMGEAVNAGNKKLLSEYVRKQLIYITVITIFVLVAGGAFGIPVLNFLYNTDLSEYWMELVILFIGGGLYAVSQFMAVPIVSMRKHNDIAVIYVFSTIIAIPIGGWLVARFAILGASILYLVINTILTSFLMVDYRIRLTQFS